MFAVIKTMTPLQNFTRVTICACLLIATGCASSKPKPNPIAGWTFHPFNQYALPSAPHRSTIDPAIAADCQRFVASNQLLLRNTISGVYQDRTGKQAIDFVGFSINKSESWHYVLVYNQFHKRVKVIKYDQHKYTS